MELILKQIGQILIDLQKNDKLSYAFFDQLIYGKQILVYNQLQKKYIKAHIYLNQRNPEMLIYLDQNSKRLVFDFRMTKIYRNDYLLQMTHFLSQTQYLILKQSNSKIIIIFGHKQDKQKFAFGMKTLIRRIQSLQSQFDPAILKNFIKADTNQNMELSKQQLQGLLSDIKRQYDDQIKNIVKYVKKSIKSSNTQMTYRDFEKLAKILSCRNQLIKQFQNYTKTKCNNYDSYLQALMTKQSFKSFLEYQQKINNSKQLQKVTNKVFGQKPKISFYQFSQYITSQMNTAIDTQILDLQEDESRPLLDYYCYSSHNTYLTGNQLTSDSKAERYWQDLQDGIRCVQIDAHDGDDIPIVKHGYTMTSAVSFQEVINNISYYSQTHPNHTPIILSIQNHCNNKNQLKMANIMNNYFKDKILKIQDPKQKFPSLKQCRDKIIIKISATLSIFKKYMLSDKKHQNDSQVDVQSDKSSDGQYQTNEQKNMGMVFGIFDQLSSFPQTFIKYKKLFEQKLTYLKKDRSQFIRHQKNIHNFIQNSFHMHQAEVGKQKLNLKLLSMTSILGSGKLGSPSSWESISVSQSKFIKYFENQSDRLSMLMHSKLGWIRAYPLGSRVDSSNYNPIPAFQMGVQLIALNTQSTDPYTLILKRFFDKGKNITTGYRLRSNNIYSDSQINQSSQTKKRSITVLSAIKIYQNKISDVIPGVQVKLSFVGSSYDMVRNKTECQHNTYTELIKGNGFNPIFKNSKRFTVRYINESFAFIFVQIEKCGISILPLQSLRLGYRVISLYDGQLQRKQSKILCHIQ